MRKLILTSVVYDTGEGPIEKTHIVALNLPKFNDIDQNQELKMAADKAKAWYSINVPHAKFISATPVPTITSDGVWANDESALSGSAHNADEIPYGATEEGPIANYVLIDLNGYRKPEDFEIGFFNSTTKEWSLKYGKAKINLFIMRWMYLPVNKE